MAGDASRWAVVRRYLARPPYAAVGADGGVKAARGRPCRFRKHRPICRYGQAGRRRRYPHQQMSSSSHRRWPRRLVTAPAHSGAGSGDDNSRKPATTSCRRIGIGVSRPHHPASRPPGVGGGGSGGGASIEADHPAIGDPRQWTHLVPTPSARSRSLDVVNNTGPESVVGQYEYRRVDQPNYHRKPVKELRCLHVTGCNDASKPLVITGAAILDRVCCQVRCRVIRFRPQRADHRRLSAANYGPSAMT